MPETPDISAAVPAEATPPLSEGETAESAETTHVPETAKEHETMLDVHPAHHAASSWKEFFIHIATIVLGLLIAVGLEQAVEHSHHRREVAEVREELRGEREANKDSFRSETTNWRWETAELENNLMVLAYLQKHPGTPDEKLPGSLVWFHASAPNTQAAWDAAKNSGVTSLMHREEVEQYEDTYNKLKRIDDARSLAYDGMNDASRYELTDNRLSHLSPAQIAEITTLTQIALCSDDLADEGGGVCAVGGGQRAGSGDELSASLHARRLPAASRRQHRQHRIFPSMRIEL
ncbi:hypothetical protein [Tunturiibacter gelidoferens]|uniref:Uncharacterized protein n=1 Tax=Tunturiibacter lichenicola TaxID=2051959 RepID=A0A7Y9NQ61_9BACT|nr:hypothetical protein [Edaphobacter lichenicola]NYF53499.1 hypothetical protein [Edaphobacter lichenicola]